MLVDGPCKTAYPKKTAMAPISPLRMLESKEVAFEVGLFSKALLK
jgi:hypothetical protein